jgi:hypothetical protein
MTLRSVVIVSWTAIGCAVGTGIFNYVVLTERPLALGVELLAKGPAVIVVGALCGLGSGLRQSRSIPDGPADEEAIARLHRTTMTLALLIYAAVAEFFMSGASREVAELAPSRPPGGHLAVSSENWQGPVAYAVKFHITRSETD